MVLMVWGMTFYFVWFSVISNPEEMDTMKNTLTFNCVTFTIYTVPAMFFCSGFLQTHSFLTKDKEESMFTGSNLGKFYFKRIFRYMPLNIVALLTVTNLLPYLGSGPVWNKFDNLV